MSWDGYVFMEMDVCVVILVELVVLMLGVLLVDGMFYYRYVLCIGVLGEVDFVGFVFSLVGGCIEVFDYCVGEGGVCFILLMWE